MIGKRISLQLGSNPERFGLVVGRGGRERPGWFWVWPFWRQSTPEPFPVLVHAREFTGLEE